MSRQNTEVKVDAVTDLCIQIQPHRAPDLDVAAVRNRCAALASNETVIERFAVVEGPDEVAYINLMFATQTIGALWELLQRHLYGDEAIGTALSKSSMAMCEGSHGWDDYLQLHHFDPKVKLDNLTDD